MWKDVGDNLESGGVYKVVAIGEWVVLEGEPVDGKGTIDEIELNLIDIIDE